MADNRVGALSVLLNLDTRRFGAGLARAERRLSATARRMDDLGRRTADVGRSITTGLSLPLAAVAAVTGKLAFDFRREMNNVQAITLATGEVMGQLEERARVLGRTTRFTATEAAQGIRFLVQAGLDASQALKLIGPSLNFAAAASLELGEATDLLTDVQSAYNLAVEESDRITSALIVTAQNATTDVRQLREGLKNAASASTLVNGTIEETSAALGIMANNLLKAGRGGTALQAFILDLVKNTDEAARILKDANVRVDEFRAGTLELADIVRDLEEAQLSAGEAAEVFGRRGLRGYNALIGRSQDLEEVVRLMRENRDIAEQVARIQLQGIVGAFFNLKSAVEGAFLALGDAGLTGALQRIANFITALARRFADTSEETRAFVAQVVLIGTTVGPAVLALGLMIRTLGFVARALTFASTAAIGFRRALIIGLVAAVPLAITAVAQALVRGGARIFEWLEDLNANFGPRLAEAIRAAAPFAAAAIARVVHVVLEALRFVVPDLLQSLLPSREETARRVEQLEKFLKGQFSGMAEGLAKAFAEDARKSSFISGFLEGLADQIGPGALLEALEGLLDSAVPERLKGFARGVLAEFESLNSEVAEIEAKLESLQGARFTVAPEGLVELLNIATDLEAAIDLLDRRSGLLIDEEKLQALKDLVQELESQAEDVGLDRITRDAEALEERILELGRAAGILGTEQFDRLRERAVAAFEEINREVEETSRRIRVDLGGSLADAFGQQITGILRGTRESIDAVEAFRGAVASIFQQLFRQILAEKLVFDKEMDNNFRLNLPKIAEDGARKIGEALSGVFGGGGGGVPAGATFSAAGPNDLIRGPGAGAGGGGFNWVGALGSLFTSFIPGLFSFHEGGLARDEGIARVKAGEMVIPPADLDRVLGGGGREDTLRVVNETGDPGVRGRVREVRGREGGTEMVLVMERQMARAVRQGGPLQRSMAQSDARFGARPGPRR